MTSSSPARYYVHGIELVNCGGAMCEACGVRMAVGRSIGGNVVCGRCAGWAAVMASEYATEIEASRLRRAPLVAQQFARLQEKMAESTGEARPGDRQRGRNGGRG